MRLAEKVLNVTIYRRLPRGVDPLYDLTIFLPTWHPAIIFDVGANIGQSAAVYAKKFGSANIMSFEPCAETFQQLKRNVSHYPNVQCIKLAFASEAGVGLLVHGIHSDINQIISNKSRDMRAVSGISETVEQTTLDIFCAQNRFKRIDYLKVDTEGVDLDVLRGSEQMLRNGLIDVIEIEAGVGLDNELHVPLQDFRTHLESRGYHIFGFYEQVNEWKKGLPHLRRTNVVFISNQFEKLVSKSA